MNATELYQIEALGPSGPYRARRPTVITDVTGMPVAELSLVPLPFVARAMSGLRRSTMLDWKARLAAIAEAGRAFNEDEIAGLTADAYCLLVSRISGLGVSEVSSAVEKIAAYSRDVWHRTQFARPEGVAEFPDDARTATGAGVWRRRGEVFGVHAAGNHPAIHGGWLEALALGYKVAVRPSRREPLTPHRLVTALWEAGFSRDHVVMLPTDYDAADEMLRESDLAMAYGGQDVVEKYRHLDLLPQGPGRSKMLLRAGTDWRERIDLVAESAMRGGGTGCTNVTAVLVEGDQTSAANVARALAERLASIPSLPPEDPEAILPVHTVEGARAIEDFLRTSAAGSTPVLGGDGIVDELGDGSAVLRPAVHLLDSAAHVQAAAVELAFPCVWVSSWNTADGLEPLRNTLNLVLMGESGALIDEALDDLTIRNVYVGELPSFFSRPGMPHDNYLAGFLMRSKGYVRVS